MSNNKTNEKICTFFVSDYHFEMKSLPYITKNLEKDKSIIILTENDLKGTIEELIQRTNLNVDTKEKVLNLNWKNDDLNKFKEIKENAKSNKETLIFVKGKLNYIKNVNKNIDKWIHDISSVKIVDCYDMNEIGENIDEIMDRYKVVLNTSGEKEIEKI